jgi:type II secretion system protein C
MVRTAVIVLSLFPALLFSMNVSEKKDAYSIILERNIFSETPPPAEEEQPKKSILRPQPPPALTSLIEVKGIMYFSDRPSFSVINIKKKKQDYVFKEGELIIEEAKIVKIEPDSVTFLYNGKDEKIKLKDETEGAKFVEVVPGIKAAPDPSKINTAKHVQKPEVREPVKVNFQDTVYQLQADTELMANLNVVPHTEGRKINGFQLNNLPSGSIPYNYGLRNGDIIHRINGVLIDNIAKGYTVYNQIMNEGKKLVTVEVIRDSKPVIFSFRLQ